MKVLVTRPRLFADSLCNSLKKAGISAFSYPSIEIIPNPLIDYLSDQILALQQSDIALFCSRSAVIYGMKAIKTLLPRFPKLLWCAQGPGTASEMYQQGLSNILFPKDPPFESESLLDLYDLQNVKNKRIALFRGNEGRKLLRDTLIERGAIISEIEVYQRRLPKKETLQKLTMTENASIDAVITCSLDALKNLQQLAEPKVWTALKSKPFIIVGLRMEAFAANLGIRSRIMAKAAKDKDLIEALTTLREVLV